LRIQCEWVVRSWGEIAWVASVKWRVRLGIVALRWAMVCFSFRFFFSLKGLLCAIAMGRKRSE
jgi:hypothetical protein